MTIPVETRATAEAFAQLAEKHPREFQKLYGQALGGGEVTDGVTVAVAAVEPEQMLLMDAKGNPLLVSARVKTPDGELGRVKRLSAKYQSALVETDGGRKRTIVARKLTCVKPRGRAAVTVEAA